MDPAIVAQIKTRLREIEQHHRVRVLWAVESGSRGWGFPSPDSDYDCRFIYLRSPADYLALYRGRDVIETPIEDVFDVNGWDLQKALRLMLKGNAVILEWLRSPFSYAGNADFCKSLLQVAERVARRDAVAEHYFHLALNMQKRIATESDSFPLKKLFYVLRPVMALRCMRLHPALAFPPMSFLDQMSLSDLPAPMVTEITGLLARKAVTRELGAGPCPPALAEFVTAEIELCGRHFVPPEPIDSGWIELADTFFRSTLDQYAPA